MNLPKSNIIIVHHNMGYDGCELREFETGAEALVYIEEALKAGANLSAFNVFRGIKLTIKPVESITKIVFSDI